MLTTSVNSGPKSLCEIFSQVDIPAQNKRKQNTGKRKIEVEKISGFILSHLKVMDHEKEFKDLFALVSDPKDFFKRFATIKTTILTQADIFQKQIAKPKYQQLDSEKIPPLQITRINNLVAQLIAKIKGIDAAVTFNELITSRIKVGTLRILDSKHARNSLPKKSDNHLSVEAKEESVQEFFKEVAKNIFKEEVTLYQQYRNSLPLENNLKESHQVIASIAEETYKTYVENVRTYSSYLFRGFSKSQLNSEKPQLQIGEVVMYTSQKNKEKTYFGRILEIQDNQVKIRNRHDHVKTLPRDRIVQ